MPHRRIVPLHERPDLAPTCAAWSYGEWGCLVGSRSLEQVIASYQERALHRESLPQTWVYCVGEKPAAMISLRAESSHPDLQAAGSPWLGSLYVHPAFRGKGIAKELCGFLAEEAKRRGYEKVYLFTGIAKEFYLHLGWREIGKVKDPMGLREEGDTVMEFPLPAPAAP